MVRMTRWALALVRMTLVLALAACAPSQPGRPGSTSPARPTAAPASPAPTAGPTSTPIIHEEDVPPPTITPHRDQESLGPHDIEGAFPGLSFVRPVHLASPGDGTGRIFVVLQGGRIVVFPNRQDVASADVEVFLDIRDRTLRGGNEEGLLGLAFDPGFERNGHFYVYYSARAPDEPDYDRKSVLSRFSVKGSNPSRATVGSELTILEVPQPYSNHNGGTIAFGPDGYLYVALGDGGAGGDPRGNGQNPGTLLGSILRLDVAGATSKHPYSVPPDNPFVDEPEARPEVWAYGLRNPWRFTFDPASGDLWAGDVGQNSYEEVDLIRRDGNYGWNDWEGLHTYPRGKRDPYPDHLVAPVHEYPLERTRCAVSGGPVYRGDRVPSLKGAYVFADFCSGEVWALRYDNGQVIEHDLLNDSGLRIPGFGEDAQGNLYILSFNTPGDGGSGGIFRFAAEAMP